MRVVEAASWSALAADLITVVLASLPSDPLEGTRVVVRGRAAGRALGQEIARRTGTSAEGGVCCGLETLTLAALRHEVEAGVVGHDPDSDPWRRRPLSLTVLGILKDSLDEPWMEPVRQHLLDGRVAGSAPANRDPRPGRWFSTADRIAGLLRHYTRDAPEMIRAWTRGDNTSPGGDPLPTSLAWQPEIWRACHDQIPVSDPVERLGLLTERLAADPTLPGLPDPLLILDPGPLSLADHAFLRAVAATRTVVVWTLTPTGGGTLGRRVGASAQAGLDRLLADAGLAAADALADADAIASANEPTGSVLGRLQESLLHDAVHDIALNTAAGGARPTPTGRGTGDHPTAPDRSVQVHASHGPNRQVEVLRDVLCGVFERVRDLEPREAVVVCLDPQRYAPLVRAAFAPAGTPTEPALDTRRDAGSRAHHPGTALRVQMSRGSVPAEGPATDLLRTLLTLPASRRVSSAGSVGVPAGANAARTNGA